MVTVTTEATLRECLRAMGGDYGQIRSVLCGGYRRQEFVAAWQAVLDDADVQTILGQTLFVPSRIPDHEQGVRLLQVLDQVRGQPTTLEVFDDVVTTEAEVVAVTKISDGEGPAYRVTYRYRDRAATEHLVDRCYGYDSTHASMNGWGAKELDAYWQVGRRHPCRYRASQPNEHAIAMP